LIGIFFGLPISDRIESPTIAVTMRLYSNLGIDLAPAGTHTPAIGADALAPSPLRPVLPVAGETHALTVRWARGTLRDMLWWFLFLKVGLCYVLFGANKVFCDLVTLEVLRSTEVQNLRLVDNLK
jgi:hypothetical protein